MAKEKTVTYKDYVISHGARLASSEESRLLLGQRDPKKLFLSLVEDAKADGVVTDEEREYLIPRGLRAGYSLKDIEQMLVIK